MTSAISDRSCPSSREPKPEALERRVSIALLRALAGVVQQRGIALRDLLGAGADAILTESADGTLPLVEFQALFTRAVNLTNEPALGLLCGLQAADSSFGLMAPLISHAPTLRKALELICQFQSLLMTGVNARLYEHLGTAELRCENSHPSTFDRSVAELQVAGLVRTLRVFGCTRRDIVRVRFAHSRPAHFASYTVAFAGAERFAQEFTGVEFSACALDRPHLHHQSELQELLLAHAERSLERLSRPLSCTERVRALIQDRPASQLPDMVAAARALGISVRSLRRRLLDEGTSYRVLITSRLHELACSMLRNPEATLQRVAYDLGFSNATAFHRAFRR